MTASFTFPAIRAAMGSTAYFQATVRARDLAALGMTVGETAEWSQLSIAERFQRELAERRIRDEIVPYLVRSKDRFFGSLILVVRDPEDLSFEPLHQYMNAVPAAIRAATDAMGVLTIRGGKSCVVLDGQHRFAALRAATSDRYRVQGEYLDEVANDELSVIFIPFEDLVKTRRIFNKVNRYAKPTNPSDNIITSEDDGYAVIARWLVDTEPPQGLTEPQPPLNFFDFRGEPIVEWRSTKLEADSYKLTTLLAVYQSVEAILRSAGFPALDEKTQVNRPANDILEPAYDLAATWWSKLLTGFRPFAHAQQYTYRIPDMRRYNEKNSLLFRPIGQVAMIEGLVEAVRRGVVIDDAIDRANAINWRASADIWVDTIIFSNGRMNAKRSAVHLAGRLVTYMIAADTMTDHETNALRIDYGTARGRSVSKLPAPIRKSC